ncbi:MAG: VanW family protein [Dethiobacter sp.]|nr:VanW family protein [Dethiobacter sp.]
MKRWLKPWRATILLLLSVIAALFFLFNIGERSYRYFFGVKPGVTLDGVPVERMLADEVRSRLEKIALALERAPRNARYDPQTGNIFSEVPGIAVDVQGTLQAVMEADRDEKIAIFLLRLEPELTVEHFQSITRKITSFSTSGGGSAGRTDNLYIAARYMDGTVLAPGDVFSFNKTTGPFDLERGYSMAPIVGGGGMGIGGGVCQVATTLYNAALQARLEIMERHQHSVSVRYVPPGKDATVTNYIDLKLRNSTDSFIKIRSGASGGYVWVQIWSQ